MSTLLIDAGNTRIKWARLQGSRLGRVQAAAWSRDNVERIAQRLFRGASASQKVVVASVAGAAVDAALRRAAKSAGAPAPRFIRSSRRLAGVTSAYRVPARLGVDRWVALIGARARWSRRALCLVSIGTATTVDVLDGRGQHRGGWIIPGPCLMVESLLARTALIRQRARARAARGGAAAWARDTRAAVEIGAAQATAAVLRHAQREAACLLKQPILLVISGGGVRPNAAGGREAPVIAPHLVLAGLAVLAQQPQG